MNVEAKVRNTGQSHEVRVRTDGREQSLTIPPKADGRGSGANGAELLLLALATCYVNDIHREAARRGMAVTLVEVVASAVFGAEGAPGADFRYEATVHAGASEEEIRSLMQFVDGVAEIQNTLRSGASVTLARAEAVGA